ncbi:MAG: bifunctional hydroxymethylpyrimidine kinase/phosphomethylpyrimidine kinase [Thermoanaerobaculia bacterium]
MSRPPGLVARRTPPRVLAIAGSDSGGGAGIQADLKTYCAHGAYGMTVITAVTAQNTRAVTSVHPIPAEVVSAQLDAVLSDIGADAVKIGMLADAEIVVAVARALEAHLGEESNSCPVVLDPVMVAKSGDLLLREDAVSALLGELLPLATVITPNLPEAEVLGGRRAPDHESRVELAAELARLGPAVLLKGGHSRENPVRDVLHDGSTVRVFSHPRIRSNATHGTGCTLSSALAARLARGEPLERAAAGAVEYLQLALAAAFPLGSGEGGHGPVDHLFESRSDGVRDRE